MKVIYRQGRKEDSYRISELDYIASGGAAEFLFHDLVPNTTPVQIVAYDLEQDHYPHTYRSAIVAEFDRQIIGMALSYPAELHCINEQMQSFFPEDRLNHFREFFSTRVEGSFYLDAICVDEKYRSKGIGKELLEHTKRKALDEGYNVLSLIVFADNAKAINFYEKHGFVIVKPIELKPHELTPHEGGCVLMKAGI